MDLMTSLIAARKVSTPLIAVRTPDPAETARTIGARYPTDPVIGYDLVRGPQWMTPPGFAVCWRILLDKAGERPPETAEELERVREELMLKGLAEVLEKAQKFPERSVLVLHNAQRYLDKPEIAQGISNLRTPDLAKGIRSNRD